MRSSERDRSDRVVKGWREIAITDTLPIITALILDRPTCLECLVVKAGVTPGEAVAGLEQVANALRIYRETDRCRACGDTTEVLSARRATRQTQYL